MPRTEHKTTPKVENGYLYDDVGGCSVGSAAWFAWLDMHTIFYFVSPDGTFTARRESRRSGHFDKYYWYAYRRDHNVLYKCYLGRPGELSVARLADVAQQLAEKIK
jgi:hypothetical protein